MGWLTVDEMLPEKQDKVRNVAHFVKFCKCTILHLLNHKEHLLFLLLAASGWQIWLDDAFSVPEEFAGAVHIVMSAYIVVSVGRYTEQCHGLSVC